MRILVACEYSGRVRAAFRDLGFDAWSCDLLPSEDGSPYHIQTDVLGVLGDGWSAMVAHPTCTRLANSGVRWLKMPPPGRTVEEMQQGLEEGVAFYLALRDAPIPFMAIENPVMHKHAREMIKPGPRQVVQPWWFGEPQFKATGFELIGLPPLVATNRLSPPKSGTPEHREWSSIHRASPGPERWKFRSRTFRGVADAIASQWGSFLASKPEA